MCHTAAAAAAAAAAGHQEMESLVLFSQFMCISRAHDKTTLGTYVDQKFPKMCNLIIFLALAVATM